MSALPKPRYSFERYLELEEKALYKSEYYDGEIFAMAGATANHVKITGNIDRQLGKLLEGKPCFPMNSHMKVLIESTGLTTYPDVIVVCGEERYFDHKENVLLNPSLVVEVISKSTERYDRVVKLRQYQTAPSIMAVLLVAQNEPRVEVYHRSPKEEWLYTEIVGLSVEVPIDFLGVSIPMSAIYERVRFPTPELQVSNPADFPE